MTNFKLTKTHVVAGLTMAVALSATQSFAAWYPTVVPASNSVYAPVGSYSNCPGGNCNLNTNYYPSTYNTGAVYQAPVSTSNCPNGQCSPCPPGTWCGTNAPSTTRYIAPTQPTRLPAYRTNWEANYYRPMTAPTTVRPYIPASSVAPRATVPSNYPSPFYK